MNTSYLDDFQGKWKDKTFLIEGAGHFVNDDQPEAFSQLLLQFASEVFG